jgi:hypothetical protein
MSTPHPFRETNPKHLDCGGLIDAETDQYIRPATAEEAAKSLKAQRHEGNWRGVIGATPGFEPTLAWVRRPEDMSLADWRLAVALKLKAERRLFGRRR